MGIFVHREIGFRTEILYLNPEGFCWPNVTSM